MKNEFIGLMILVLAPTLAVAQSKRYSPSKSVVTCLDNKTEVQFRFQVGGNWMEMKSKSANHFTTCESSVTPWGIDNTVVRSPSDYDLKKITDFTYSSNRRVGYGAARYFHMCEEQGSKASYSFLSKAEQMNHEPGDVGIISNFETLYVALSEGEKSQILRFGVDESGDKIPANFDCTNLDQPRYTPNT